MFDQEWRYSYVSPRAAELLGRSVEELVGRNAWLLFPQARFTRCRRVRESKALLHAVSGAGS